MIPVIDLAGSGSAASARRIATQLDEACRGVGAFLVANHGIDLGLIDRLRAVSCELFAQSDEDKRRLTSANGNPFRGWAPTTVEGIAGPVRVHEQFEVSRFDTPEDVRAAGYAEEWVRRAEANVWPSQPPELESIWKAFFDAMDELGSTLLSLLALALGLPPDWFADRFGRAAGYLACHRYASPGVDLGGALRLLDHTDIGSLTIVCQDDGPGALQVRAHDGRWHDVAPVAGTLVVNLGDLFARWTNGRWVAPRHRVVSPPIHDRRPRMSITYFQHPDFDAVIDCLPTCIAAGDAQPYAPVVAGEWALQRMGAADAS